MNAERYSAVTESTTSPESPDNKHPTLFVTEDPKGADVYSQPQSRGDLAHALNEAELRRVIDTIPALAWSSHSDGSVDFVNQRWTGYTGLSPEESYGWGWKTAIHPDDLPALAERWEAISDVNTARECEVRLRRSDGVFRWFSLRRELLRDESRALVRWYGTAADIEDRKQTETLRAAENRTLEMIANGANLSDVLNNLCAAIDDQASATSFVCLMDRDGAQLSPFAGPHVPPAFARTITTWPIGPNRGSCGTAAFTKERVIIPDISERAQSLN
jgi:PAS domain S-box-containing protein